MDSSLLHIWATDHFLTIIFEIYFASLSSLVSLNSQKLIEGFLQLNVLIFIFSSHLYLYAVTGSYNSYRNDEGL